MADAIVENLFLVNAPAGSGKTTWIRKNVRKYLLQNPNDNVLCITYTNRAAEELGKDVDSNRVYFGTIHSFINDFIGSFFSHESILELYWEGNTPKLNNSTYIDPQAYNYVFADTDLQSMNFWVQIGFDIEARIVMSAKIMPTL